MIFPSSERVNDYWRVNSYGYPCYFSDGRNSQEAWSTLLTFYDFNKYDELKAYWASSAAPRRLSPQAVESWKATFEEFGLLYVLSRSNQITISPAGFQIREAFERDDRKEFAWIGLNLLLRYPLRGPRKPKSNNHSTSDLLPYRFLYSAMLELDGYIWWTELERVLCRVFLTEDCEAAVHDVLQLRSDPELLSKLTLPAKKRQGGFYNSLNQVAVHSSMNHLLWGTDTTASPYGVGEPSRKHFIQGAWRDSILHALLLNSGYSDISSCNRLLDCIKVAPKLPSEAEYFEYLGEKVLPFQGASNTSIDTQVTTIGQYEKVEEQLSELDNRVATSRKDSSENRKVRLKKAEKKPNKIVCTSVLFDRNPDVIAEVLLRADGICEGCNNPAPFLREKDGSPYLEVHHCKPLAQGGDDTVENAIGLCPNCHRRAHYGQQSDPEWAR